MPDSVELNVERALGGLALEDEESRICDFSIEEQNSALESEGLQGGASVDHKVVVGENLNYVVVGVFVNENDEVLMIQEAKKSCAGEWYLPAGRLQRGETITEAAEREVLEEAGLIVKCTTLLMIETAGGLWLRFILTGDIIGGSLKTPAQADEESLQAKWVGDLKELTLRGSDIIPLIDRAKAHKKARAESDSNWHGNLLPSLRRHDKLLLRVVVVIKKRASNRVHVLLSERTAWHLPLCEINPTKSLHSTLRRFMIELFGADVPSHRPHGCLSVEYNPEENNDGLCMTLLVAFKAPLEEVPIIGKCVWHETSQELGEKLLRRVAARNSTVAMHVIR